MTKSAAFNTIQGFYPIVNVTSAGFGAYALAEKVLSSGVGLLQLRQTSEIEAKFLDVAREFAYLKIHNDFVYIVNHFVSIAHDVGADGVHLKATSVAISEARKIMGPDKIIGVSVHSVAEGVQKAQEGADYLSFGSIYPTQGKAPDHPVQGLDKLKELVSCVDIPVVAVGGMTLDRVSEVMQTGAHAFSVISSLSEALDPGERAKEFLKLQSA